MAQATNSTEGTIVLSGDLLGNDANNPTLRPSGVTPGTYQFVKKIYVDSKGRTTSIKEMTDAEFVALITPLPDATTSTKGAVQAGTNINVSSGVISVPNATTSTKGVMQVGTGSSGLSVSSGTVSFDETTYPVATTSTLGRMQVGAGLDVSSGVISVKDASTSQLGIVQVGDGLTISGNILTSAIAGPSTLGFVKTGGAGTNLTLTGDTVSVPTATTSTLGMVQVGSGLLVDGSGVLSLQTTGDATTSSKGVVQIGNGISVASGVISVADATASKGLARIGSGLTATGADLSLPIATASVRGACQPGSGLSISGGVLSMTAGTSDATTGAKGIVQIGSGLSVTSGVVSRVGTGDATNAAKGFVQVGNGFVVSSGVLSLTPATSSQLGGIRVTTSSGPFYFNGANLDINTATLVTPGAVKVGSGFSVSSGLLSVNLASTTVFGVCKPGTGLVVNSGVLEFQNATTSVKGIIQVGTGLNVASGVISTQDATTSTKGLVQIGTNLAVSSGVVSFNAPNAAVGTAGKLSFGSDFFTHAPTNTTYISGAVIPTLFARTGNAENTTKSTFSTGGIAHTIETLTYGTNIAIDISNSNVKFVTLTGDATLSNPTNYVSTGVTYLIVLQDGTGSHTLSYSGNYKTDGGSIQAAADTYTLVKITSNSSTSHAVEHFQIS